MNDNTSKCRKCGQPVYWHKSRNGKNYPCDSPDDRRAFHVCPAIEAQLPPKVEKPTPAKVVPPKPKVKVPVTLEYFEGTIEQRVAHLEQTVNSLVRVVVEIQQRQPITSEDVGL